MQSSLPGMLCTLTHASLHHPSGFPWTSEQRLALLLYLRVPLTLPSINNASKAS